MVASPPVRSTLPYLLFAVLVVVFLWKPIFTGQALLPGDYLAQMSPWKSVIKSADPPPQWNPLQWDAIAQFYPWRVFYAKWMGQGIIPLWNPHQFCGTPFLANGQSAVLYPLNLVFLTFDPITAFTVYAALHLFLAAAFMYLLLRELGCKELGGIVGGITFAFCAFMVRWLELPTFVGAAVWLPLSLFLIHRAVERRSVFHGTLAGLVVALAFLAGHIQIAFYVLLASIMWWLWKLGQVWRSDGRGTALLRVAIPCGACLVILVLIASAQMLPTFELARNSHRAVGPTTEGYEWFIGNSLKAYHLITAFVPDFYGSPATNNFVLLGRLDATCHVASAADYMEYGMYAGILPLMLALIGLGSIRKPNVGFFALLSGLALLCALGTPINWPLYYLVPGFSAMGGPNRILLLYLFGIAGLAGFGADWLAQYAPDAAAWRGRSIKAGYKALCAAIIVVLVAIACDTLSRPLLARITGAPEPPGPFMLTVGRFAVFFLCAVLLVLARSTDRISRGTFAGVAVGLIAADLFAAGINYNPTCDRGKVYPRTELTDKLQKIARNERIAPINPTWSLFQTPDAILPPNSAMVYGLYDVQGYDSLYTREYKDLSSDVQGQDSSPVENGNMVVIKRADPRRLAEYMGSRFIISADGISELPGEYSQTWRTANRYDGPFGAAPDYPGWEMSYLGRRIPNCRMVSLAPRPDRPNAEFTFEPLTFRLGLFLMLTGIAAISCVGTFRVARRRHARP
jgi:hypothetical protein